MTRTRALLMPVTVAVILLGRPEASLAHAGLVSSTPEAGTELGTAPALVVLHFSEPLNARLSSVSLGTPDGRSIEGRLSGSEEMTIRQSANVQGVYRVSWRTVSVLDGHTLSGSYEFGVGVAVGSGTTSGAVTKPAMIDLAIAVARVIEDAALLLAVGFILLERLASREPALAWVRVRPAPALALAFVAGIAVVLSEAIVAAGGPAPGAIGSYLTTGVPGVARLLRPALELAAFLLATRRSRWAPATVAGAIAALAAAGHAAAVSPSFEGVGVEAIHVAAGAVWVGGIMALALQRPPGGWSGDQSRSLLDRFTPVALVAFALTATTGFVRGAQQVGSIHELVVSSYGLTLLVKSLLVVLVASLSSLAWRRVLVKPRLESALAVMVIAAAALLAAFPVPPSRLSEAENKETEAEQEPGLPQAGDLTLGDHAGSVLVGLTLRPGEPGRNGILVYTLPAKKKNTVRMFVSGARVALESCGPTCHMTALDLSGGERIAIHVDGPDGGVASFKLPPLPAPDGRDLLDRMEGRMQALETYREEDTLSSGRAIFKTTYALRAPNRMESRSTGGFRIVWIGTTRYLRKAPGAGWTVQSGGPTYSVPAFIWDYVPDQILDARILEHARVDGVPSTILAFYGEIDGAAPVWFRLWVDESGLVRRAEMRAQGHFMDQRYFDFDTPITIAAPKGAST